MKAHKPGIHEGFLVKHSLRLTGLTPEAARSIDNELNSLYGVDHVELDPDKGFITIAYDGSQHNIDELMEFVRMHGATVGSGWWNQLKLGFDRQIDQNVRDNAGHHPVCCNKGPDGKFHPRD